MVTTVYDYISLADLEGFIGYDLSTIDAVKFHDDKVNTMIGSGERMVNGYLGVSTLQTITDGLWSAVLILSAKIVLQNMVQYGYTVEGIIAEEVLNWTMREIFEMFLDSDQSIGVDAIPMSGAD